MYVVNKEVEIKHISSFEPKEYLTVILSEGFKHGGGLPNFRRESTNDGWNDYKFYLDQKYITKYRKVIDVQFVKSQSNYSHASLFTIKSSNYKDEFYLEGRLRDYQECIELHYKNNTIYKITQSNSQIPIKIQYGNPVVKIIFK